jgi:hypothetical protein
VAEHLVLGQAAAQYRMHGLHVEQALACEAAFAEQVLVDLRTGGAVGIDAALPGEHAVEVGVLARQRQRRHQPRLQDAVAGDHAATVGAQHRLVGRVGGHADQLSQAAGRQLCVAVQRDDVARACSGPRQRAQIDEGGRAAVIGFGVGGLGQRGHQLLELAALALPADPASFAAAVATPPMQQQEPRLGAGMTGVEFADLAHRLRQQSVVAPRVGGVGIRPVGQQRELRLFFRVRQVVQFEAVHQGVDGGAVAEHRGDHHQHAMFGRDAGGQRQAWQAARPRGLGDDTVQQRCDGFRGRPGQQRQRQPDRLRSHLRPQVPDARDDDAGAQRQRGEVQRQQQGVPGTAQRGTPGSAQAQRLRQRRPSGALQPVAGRRGAVGSGVPVHQRQQRPRDVHLRTAAALRQALDAVQRVVLGAVVFGGEQRRGEHQPHQRACARHDLRPVCVTDRAQRRHGVAHAQVVGGLLGALLRLNRGQVRQHRLQPRVHGGRHALAGAAGSILHALPHLGQEHRRDAALRDALEKGRQRRRLAALDAVAAAVGQIARRLVGGQPLGQATQVFHQHHAQRGRQRPHLAQLQFTRLLVGAQQLHQQVLVEGTVGVRDEGPGHAVDARQSGQRLGLQHRQAAEIAARQAFVDGQQLGVDEVEVVQQPLRRRADVNAGGRLRQQHRMRLAQHADVAAQARKETGLGPVRAPRLVRQAEAAAMLRQALRAEDLRAQRCQQRPGAGVQQAALRRGQVGHQVLP